MGFRPPLAALLPVALLLSGPAPAQPMPRSELPGLGEVDPRRLVDVATAPWRAIGRVQLEIGGRCTGALVAPRVVLTAAHCLVAPRSRVLVRPGTVHFLLGYHLGQAAAHARVVEYRTGPGFRPDGGGQASEDWALLTLDAPLAPAARVLPVIQAPPAPRTPLMLGGYQQDRPEVLLADTGCRAIGFTSAGRDALLLHDCAGTRGSSGAPVLAGLPGGGWGVVGVAASVAPRVALGAAVPVAAFATWLPR